jgi:hypothetical protein
LKHHRTQESVKPQGVWGTEWDRAKHQNLPAVANSRLVTRDAVYVGLSLDIPGKVFRKILGFFYTIFMHPQSVEITAKRLI